MRIFYLLIFVTSSAFSLNLQSPVPNQNPRPYDIGPSVSHQRTRRLQAPIEHKRVSFPQYQNPRMTLRSKQLQQNKKNGVPPYAVQMEPLVQYSQPDPLYSIEKQYISEAKVSDITNNDLIKKSFSAPPIVGEMVEADTISRASHARLRPPRRPVQAPPTHLHPPPNHHQHQPSNVEFSSYGTYYEGPPQAFEEPEPIIEIIIKESNESLPAPPPLPTPPPRKKPKEPVQVFYVKYKTDPATGYGEEDKVIYDPPIPAVTPPTNNEPPEPEVPDVPADSAYPPYGVDEDVTQPPQPSTTLKAIIRPDSETFEAKGGVKISFGETKVTQGEQNEPEEHHQAGGGITGGGDISQGGGIINGGGNFNGGGSYNGGGNFNGDGIMNGGGIVNGGGMIGGAEQPMVNSEYGIPPPLPLEPQHGEYSQPQPAVVFPSPTTKSYISRSSSDGISQPRKRNPPPYNAQPPHFNQGFQQSPAVPLKFQQAPQFAAQDFKPPPLHTAQYSTLPQHFSLPQPQQPQAQPQPQPLRYHTINNPPQLVRQPQPLHIQVPPQQYHTINSDHPHLQQPNVGSLTQQHQQQQLTANNFQQPRVPIRVSSQEQHQQQVEQVNRLQQQQQQLQQQIATQQLIQNQRFQSQPAQLQHHKQVPQTNTQFIQQNSIQTQFHQAPTLQYPPEVGKVIETSATGNHRQVVQQHFTPTPLPPITQATTRATAASQYFTRTPSTTTEQVTEIVTEDPKKVEDDKKKKQERTKQNEANLPDEVPDDLRQQLLSSGILSNADIEILDYDKIGDIPIENLPPEALANFQAAAGSERREHIVSPSSEESDEADSAASYSEQRSVTVRSSTNDMEMKIVRFNPEEDKTVADKYMKHGATQLAPVVLNDSKYNRYLPLKVAGTQFPVPDVPELRGRNVTSVVVLAPVNYEFLTRHDDEKTESRVGRSAAPVLEVQGVHFVAGDVLKTLVRTPTTENYRRWLEKENMTSADKQSVVLLVVAPSVEQPEKEIFMYDIASGRVSKLRGQLSTTFVQVAESNSHNQDLDEISDSPAGPGGDFTVKEASQLLSRS